MKDISNILLGRRSIREYTEKTVGNELLNEILTKGCRASTTGNMQVYSIIITRYIVKKKELAPCHFNHQMITESPVVLTFCAYFNRFSKW